MDVVLGTVTKDFTKQSVSIHLAIEKTYVVPKNLARRLRQGRHYAGNRESRWHLSHQPSGSDGGAISDLRPAPPALFRGPKVQSEETQTCDMRSTRR
jgi:hypothetical protein